MPKTGKYKPPTDAEILENYAKCGSKKAFSEQFPGQYRHAQARKLLENEPDKRVKWTDEALAEAAKPYKTRAEFQKNANSAYQVAYRRGLLDIFWPKV